MTLNELNEHFSYDRWANRRIFDCVASLSPEQYMQEMKSSHGNIHTTLLHFVGTQKVWVERWNGTWDDAYYQTMSFPTFETVKALWESTENDWKELLSSLHEEEIEKSLTVTSSKGEEFTHTLREIALQLMYHSAYHRGQIVTMIRQLGAVPVATDFIYFLRATGGKRQ